MNDETMIDDSDEDENAMSLVDEALVAGNIANTNGLLVILAKLVAKGIFDAEDLQGGFINQTANNLLKPFPVGLSTSVGAVVANPAFGGEAVYAANFSTNAYHGVSFLSSHFSLQA